MMSAMKRAVITAALVCSVATFARADDASGDPSLTDTLTEQAKGAVNSAVNSAADGAREGAGRVTKAASDKAGQVADQATEAARKAADAAGEKARDAAAYGKDMADRVASGTKDQLHALGGRMGGVWEKCKDLFFAALAGIRDLTRTALLSAANALDESNAKARTEKYAYSRGKS